MTENKKISGLVDAKEIPFWRRVKIRIIGSVPAFTTHESIDRYSNPAAKTN